MSLEESVELMAERSISVVTNSSRGGRALFLFISSSYIYTNFVLSFTVCYCGWQRFKFGKSIDRSCALLVPRHYAISIFPKCDTRKFKSFVDSVESTPTLILSGRGSEGRKDLWFRVSSNPILGD